MNPMAKRDPSRRLFKKRFNASQSAEPARPKEPAEDVSAEYVEVLEQIEFVLLERYRGDPEMDDLTASAALRATLCDAEPVETRIAELTSELMTIREFRATVSDEIWRDALSVVDDSIHRHSQLAPGEQSYLAFASRSTR
jgi:hypothetical protein